MYIHTNMKIYLHLTKLVTRDKLKKNSALFVNLWNTLKGFANIFFNSGMVQVHSIPGPFIGANKRLVRFTILIKFDVVLVKTIGPWEN